MNETYLDIIVGLIGFLQVIFLFVLSRIFITQDKLFTLIDLSEKKLEDKIDKEKVSYTDLLEKHYVTNGQLNTLEERLIGNIKTLSLEMKHLTEAIKSNYLKG